MSITIILPRCLGHSTTSFSRSLRASVSPGLFVSKCTLPPEPSPDYPLQKPCLWAIQTHQILKARSFRFTHTEGRGVRLPERPTESTTCGQERGKSQQNGGIRRNQRANRHPGRGTREQEWRVRATNWQRVPKGKARRVWTSLPQQAIALSVTVECLL